VPACSPARSARAPAETRIRREAPRPRLRRPALAFAGVVYRSESDFKFLDPRSPKSRISNLQKSGCPPLHALNSHIRPQLTGQNPFSAVRFAQGSVKRLPRVFTRLHSSNASTGLLWLPPFSRRGLLSRTRAGEKRRESPPRNRGCGPGPTTRPAQNTGAGFRLVRFCLFGVPPHRLRVPPATEPGAVYSSATVELAAGRGAIFRTM
jgi:hypothetical protein